MTSNVRRPRRVLRGALAAAALAAFGSAAAGAQDAAAALAACAAPHCFAVAVTPELAAALNDADGATLEEVGQGLSFSYRGEEPLYVRFIAARYDRGRLVRYGVSARARFEAAGDDLAVPDAVEAVTKAFRPVTERGVEVKAMEAEGGDTVHQVALDGFVGETPVSYLASASGAHVIDLGVDDARETPYGSSVGVVVILPEDDELRTPDLTETVGAVLRLDLQTRN